MDLNIQHPPREPQHRRIQRGEELSSDSENNIERNFSSSRLQRPRLQPRQPQARIIRLDLQ